MLFSGDNYASAPRAHDIEVSLIGPGYGEAILVHPGDNQWFLIDSCMQKGATASASLRYLEDIGVPPSRVRAIIISHWDDDHIRGLAQVVTACTDADVILSKVFGDELFTTYASAYDAPLTTAARSGVKELRAVLTELVRRGSPSPIAAQPNRRIYGAADINLSHGEAFELWTLSPSDAEGENFLAWVAKMLPGVRETRRVVVKRIQNDLSTVVLLSVGADAMLFGGDLEEEGRRDTGWSAILAGGGRPQARASLFKVSHHGSINGDHPEIWTRLLNEAPLAILAPFKRGKVSLPTQSDVTRIVARAHQAFATTSMGSRSPRKRSRAVERTIRESTRSFASTPQSPGMLRMRKVAGDGGDWSVEQFGGAMPLARIYD